MNDFLRPFLWLALFFFVSVISARIAGEDDGSFTYFTFTGITYLAVISFGCCLIWLGFVVGRWAWAHM